MANMPAEGLIPSNYPFSATIIDFLDHTTSSMDVMVKRYGCLFTCFKSRAVHIKVLHSLDADSVIMVLTRFTNRRTKPPLIRYDNG